MKNFLRTAFALALSLGSVQAQPVVNFSTGATNVPGYTGYYNSGDGWNNSGDPMWSGQQGWTGNGQGADSVSVVAGYTPPSPAGNASGTLGVFLPGGGLTSTNIYLERSFTPETPVSTPNATVTFVAEWSVLNFGTLTDDTFRFDLRNVANTASLLSFTMNNIGTTPGFDYLVSSTGAGGQAQFETTYGAIMRLVVDLNDTNYSGTYQLVDGTTRSNLASFNLNPGTLGGGATAYDFGILRLEWDLASGDPSSPGDLGIVVNEFTVSTVPEPSTVALLAVAGAGLALGLRRRLGC